jgi:hypothetical protein
MTATGAGGGSRQCGPTDIHEHEYPLAPQWSARDWNVTASSGGKTLTFKSLNLSVGSVPTPPSRPEAQAVWAAPAARPTSWGAICAVEQEA